MFLRDFLSQEAGQKRREWLDDTIGNIIPPELRGWVTAGAELNPVTSVERAGTAAQRMTQPGLSGWDRMAAAGDVASNMGAVLAPVAMANKAGVPAANAIVEALTAASPMKGAAQDFAADEFGGVGFADNVASRGKQIMDMLRSGRGADVTDKMLDMGDPVANARLNEWLFNNYDLPMDAASRSARAGEMGHTSDVYRGMRAYTGGPTYRHTSRGAELVSDEPLREITEINAPQATYLPQRMAGFSSSDPKVASGFQSWLREHGAVYPLRANTDGMTAIDMEYLPAGAAQFESFREVGAPQRAAVMDAVADPSTSGVILRNTQEEGDVYIPRSPQQYRSRFARFDPRLAHLRNLSAGMVGLLPMSAYLGQQEEAQ